MTGLFSVSASFVRVRPFMWLSARWCTTWRTVQPSGRYGVSSCVSSRPPTAARMSAGSDAIRSIAALRVACVNAIVSSNLPTG